MRGKLVGVAATLLLSTVLPCGAQTPTGGPTPTPTPPPHIYLSEPDVANTATTNNQKRPAVAVGTDGNYLVVWNGDAAQTGYFDIQGQLFTRDGVKIGGEFQVDQAGPNRIAYTPDIAADGLGHYIVVWADFNSTVTDAEIWMRRLDGAANPLGDAAQVNTYTTGTQRLPRVAADQDGNVVVVWESEGQDGDGFGIFAKSFPAAPAQQGPTNDIQLNEFATGDQFHADGVWQDNYLAANWESQAGTRARAFDQALNPVSPETPIFENHSSPGVSGTDPILFLAVNDLTGRVEGRVGPLDNLGSVFPVYDPPGDWNPYLQRFCGEHPGLQDTYLFTVDEYDSASVPIQYRTTTQEIQKTSTGLREIGHPIVIYTQAGALSVPSCAGGLDGQHVWVGQGLSGGGPTYDSWFLRGRHPAAVQFAFAEGSVKFIKQNVSSDVYLALGNRRTDPMDVSGLLGNPLRPPGLMVSPTTVVVNDGTADYGAVPAGGTSDCTTTGDCYNIMVPGPRPGLHWDEAVTETLNNGVSKTWILHVGGSFADVPDVNPFIEFIENLLHNGITAGGACGGYCPLDGVKRQQMAVFLLKSLFGSSVVPPPATGTIFTDVSLANPFASWIELLYLLGITGGCSGGPPPAPTQFCPDAIVNRQQMAVFLLKALLGSGYVPPTATGIFQDLPPANPFAAWAEDLYNRQVTGGCVANPLQYCPTNPTNRQQMAAFLVKTFGLLLYGP